MLPRSLQWRLVFIILSITFILMIVVWLNLNYQVEKVFYQNFQEPIENSLSEIDKDNKLEDLKGTLAEGSVISRRIIDENKSYTIINKETVKIEYSSDPEFFLNRSRFENELLKSKNLRNVLINEGEKLEISKDSKYVKSTIGDYYDFVISKKLIEGNYLILFKYNRSVALKASDRFNNVIFTSMIVAILATLIIGFILSKTITVPITKIMHKAEKITYGDFGQLLEVKSDDEIGKLTKTFNYMSTKLKDTLVEISSEKNKIETILNYMTDGVIAFNIEGEMIHINPAAKEMFKNLDSNMQFDDFSKRYNLDIAKEELFYLEKPLINEKIIENEGKYFRVHFAFFTDEKNTVEGIVTVIQDITKQQKLNDMRKEFVANVSHELRTPLTSIKSYTETLLDGALEDKETSQHFLSVINSETDRMTRLVKDLLQLSRYDSNKIRLNKTKISIVEIINTCIRNLNLSIKEKNQDVETYVIGTIPLIMGDKDRLQQLLVNIISNAIKYTPKEGKITIYTGVLYNEVYVKVSDTGIGIPEKDIERIFERFYRVDKARSREMGGTGLGLSIAKQIVKEHGGKIFAKSEMEKGTEVTIKLPIKGE